MKIELTPSQFTTINKLFKKETGIEYPESKKGLIAFRILVRLHALKMESVDEYLKKYASDNLNEEIQELIDLLTTNETFFFREKEHFDVLAETVLPELKHKKKLRVWSAACSSGEEVYSLAMVLNDFNRFFDWEVIGSDINETVLTRAIAGIYKYKKMDAVPEDYLNKYFIFYKTLRKQYVMVSDPIYKKISFLKINLTHAFPDIGDFDIIFLRNALIYFKDDVKKQIVNNVVKLLKPGGIFVIGHSDSILNCREHLTLIDVSGVYRKTV